MTHDHGEGPQLDVLDLSVADGRYLICTGDDGGDLYLDLRDGASRLAYIDGARGLPHPLDGLWMPFVTAISEPRAAGAGDQPGPAVDDASCHGIIRTGSRHEFWIATSDAVTALRRPECLAIVALDDKIPLGERSSSR